MHKNIRMWQSFAGLLILCIVYLFPPSAQAAVFHVTDAASLQTALDTAAANNQNNTINLAAGTYDSGVDGFPWDNTSGHSLILNGHSQNDTFITSKTDTMALGTNGPVTIQNLTFKDSLASGLVFPGSAGTNTNNFIVDINHVSFIDNATFGIKVTPYVGAQGGSVTITDSTFDGNLGGGVNFSNTAGGAEPLPLTFRRNTMTKGGYGIHVETNVDGSDIVLDRNYSANNYEQWGVGMSVITDCHCASTITSNVIVNNKGQGGTAGVGVVYESRSADAGGDTLLNFTNNTIANNSESDSEAGGMLATMDTPNAVFNIYNNIFWNNSIVGGGDNGNDIAIYLNNYKRVHFLNNDIHSLGLRGDDSNFQTNGNIDADPLFQQLEGARTFQNVAQQSPVVATGVHNAPGLPSADFAGIALHNPPDMGAFTLNVVSPVSRPAQSSVHIHSCSTAPATSPDLFQINTANDEATLFFAPVLDASNYLISYGFDTDAKQFSVMTGLGQSSGVLSYTVRALPSRSTMYFKVYAQNNCGQGNWSNTMMAKVGTPSMYFKNISFQYSPPQTPVLGAKTEVVEPSPEVTSARATSHVTRTKPSQPQSKPPASEAHKKSCFLFICF